MTRTPHYIDCCQDAELSVLRTLHQSSHDLESLLRCDSCQAYWFYRFNEYVNWSGGDDDLTSWYTRLTADEGELLRAATGPGGVDLSFLTTRASWLDDNDGVRRVPGAPGRPAT